VLDWNEAVTFTISADDPRTIRAIEIAAGADCWLKGRNEAGDEVFGVPSQSETGRYHIVTRATCDCPAFTFTQLVCKHILAVRLHTELARAQQHQPRPSPRHHRPSHLTLVASSESDTPASTP
jgi:hypothetical protein